MMLHVQAKVLSKLRHWFETLEGDQSITLETAQG